MTGTLFEAKDYKAYLAKRLAPTGEGRGLRTRLAKALGCQPAHISQVLAKGASAHFSLEYAVVIDEFLRHSPEESQFFLLMVHRDRAGTKKLFAYYESQMQQIRENRTEVRRRISVKEAVPAEYHDTYYSSWIYAAVHVMLSIPRLQSVKALSEHLHLPADYLGRLLSFLEAAGLARATGGRWEITQKRIHLGPDSPLIARHHTNWRLRGIQSCERAAKEDLHYSAVFTLSEEEVVQVREIFLKSLAEAERVLIQSKEETTFGICMDFFRV